MSDSEDIKKLISALEDASKLSSKGRAYKIQCKLFHPPADDPEYPVNSWKFNEWDYGKNNINLPCNARGLFISDNESSPSIIARGYDKFFNIDEVYNTKWQWLAENTIGPYEVTLKSNGCIIFVSGLENGSLVVCSKHSTGPRDDVNKNHALAGEMKLEEQLASHNINSVEFGKYLYENNVTAIAEYCDDSFEEHVIEYSKENAGLYLHGVNLNTIAFQTWPMAKVEALGKRFGFKSTEYLTQSDFTSLRKFLEKSGKNGTYDGQEVEGFVVRCHLKHTKENFFFKFKFEEPYLMYRQWREATKDYISSRKRIYRFRKHSFITNKYMDYVIPILDVDPELCNEYMQGFGIIKLRNMFLKAMKMTGSEILNYEKIQELELKNSIDHDKVDENTKFLIFPISVIGCGKTTVALTLQNLFPDSWAHVQNDDITGKDKSMLMKKSLELLAKPGIKCCFVDRNNHQYRERKQLFEMLDEHRDSYLPYDTNIKVIGLSFTDRNNLEEVKKITTERVKERGDNHQSIKLSEYGEKKTIGIMSGFWKRFQQADETKAPDNMFDFVIYMKVKHKNSSRENCYKILKLLHSKYPALIQKVSTNEDIDIAFEKALAYKPIIVKKVHDSKRYDEKPKANHKLNEGKNKKFHRKPKAVYYSANLEDSEKLINDIRCLLEKNKQSDFDTESIIQYINEKRYQSSFHITLAHITGSKNGTSHTADLWARYQNRYIPILKSIFNKLQNEDKSIDAFTDIKIIGTDDKLKFKLDKLCWDKKILTVMVKLENECIADSMGVIIPGLECSNEFPHITFGILLEGTKPFYSNELCQKVCNSGEVDSFSVLKFEDDKEYSASVCINL